MRGNAAIKECAQLALDETRHDPVAPPLPGQEGLEMVGKYLVQKRVLGMARMVGAGGFADREAGMRRKRIAGSD